MHDNSGQGPANVNQPDSILTVLFVFGLIAPLLTFFLAVSELSVGVKTFALVGLIVIYIFVCYWLYKKVKENKAQQAGVTPMQFVTELPVIDDDPLNALDDIKDFFGTSLKIEDAFKLVAGRVNRVFPFSSAVLFVPDAATSSLNAVGSYGQNAELLNAITGDISAGVAGMAFHSAEVELDADLALEKELRADLVTDHSSAIAIPLLREGAVFAVFQMYLERALGKSEKDVEMLTSIGERISPLLLSIKAGETGISDAFADPLTDLPNERAMLLVLENQLAESQRFRNDRPLSVIAIDIKGFNEINRAYGHVSGDRLLKFAGETIRGCLRKMDFLSRSQNDEFTIILPTAPEKKASEVIARLTAMFSEKTFQLSEHEEVSLWLNYGSATFWKDGETATQLIETARTRKQQLKSEEPDELQWSKKEYLN